MRSRTRLPHRSGAVVAPGAPRRAARALAVLVVLAFAYGCSASSTGSSAPVPRTDKRPNIVIVMTDDQTVTDLQFMPKTRSLVGDQGTTFTNSFASYPLCCPSRATQLTGQYAHNHHVLNNVPPDGGNDKLDHTNTLPVWLQQAGYNTAHVGKYLNSYGETSPPVVPPGYTDWFGLIDPSVLRFWNYDVLDNGERKHYGDADTDYQTDVLAGRAGDDIQKFAAQDKPFYLTVWPLAPHAATDRGDPRPERNAVTPVAPVPAPRHVGTLPDAKSPRTKSFMEADVTDKPPSIQQWKADVDRELAARGFDAARLNEFIDTTYQARAESLLSVDDLVESLVNRLRDTGQLDNTIFVFTSDNGWLFGEHGFAFAKAVLYEEVVRVPLLIRGPAFTPGTKVSQIVANIDLAPTVAAAAGVQPGLPEDGVDIRPLVNDPEKLKNRAILLEQTSQKPPYKAVRVPGYFYAEHEGGAIEFYDLFKDPFELESKHADPAYAKIRDRLARALHDLASCAGAACTVEIPRSEL